MPRPLPPSDPSIELDREARTLLARAEQALGRLDLAGEMVPSPDWFLYAFIRKEAVVSSQIEGVQATLDDLLTFEAADRTAGAPDAHVQEVCNYVAAITWARAELGRERGLPLSMRLLNEAHRRLLKGARGAHKAPGEIRRTQNWVGGTRPGNAAFVPPPPNRLPAILTDFERYLHEADDLPPLVRAALAHAQFETIHPYLDGNGRVGRLLIALVLEQWGLLRSPLLYLSLHFKRHRQEYYRRLDAIRTEGDWESWIRFFLEGVAAIAEEATSAARELFGVVTADRARLLRSGTTSVASVRLFEELPKHPVITIVGATKLLSTTKPTATKAVQGLVDARILVETTGRKRDRLFGYAGYLDRLRGGTELST